MSQSIADVAREVEDRQRLKTCIRHIQAIAAARLAGIGSTGVDVFAERFPRSTHINDVRRSRDLYLRAAVGGGSSEPGNWAAPLGEPITFLDAFATQVRRTSALGKLGAVEVPPNSRSPFPTAPATAAWVGRGAAVPISRGSFDVVTLEPYLLAGLVVATNEIATGVGPKFEAIFSALLINAAVTTADAALLDPTVAGVDGISPKSLTFGANSVASSGGTVEALNHDLGLLADQMLAAGVPLLSPCVILSPATALRVGGLALPAPGGSLAVPVVVSPAALDQVVLLDASRLIYTDAGIGIDFSTATTLEMDSAPTSDGIIPADATGSQVSLFQLNLTALKLVQYLNWQLATPAAVGVVTGFPGGTP